MARIPKGKPGKVRVLTPSELKLADELQRAMTQRVAAEVLLKEARREISRLTLEINKLEMSRITVIWVEAREQQDALLSAVKEKLAKE